MLKLEFRDGAMILPTAVVGLMGTASDMDLRVLLALCADPYFAIDHERAIDNVSQKYDIKPAVIRTAISFWKSAGVLVEQAPMPEQPAAQPDAVLPIRAKEKGLPDYNADELDRIVTQNARMQDLLQACQQTFGKVFNKSEFATIVGMADHLGLDDDYILLLLSHCRRMGKHSIRYAEKLALSLYDEGVVQAGALETRLHRTEMMADAVGGIRALFGIGARALTAKEKKMVEKWVCEMQYPMEILRRAYEITVDSTKDHSPSIAYANTILERWFSQGYRRIEEIEQALAEYKKQKSGGSFDIDEFFAAALDRTYGEG